MAFSAKTFTNYQVDTEGLMFGTFGVIVALGPLYFTGGLMLGSDGIAGLGGGAGITIDDITVGGRIQIDQNGEKMSNIVGGTNIGPAFVSGNVEVGTNGTISGGGAGAVMSVGDLVVSGNVQVDENGELIGFGGVGDGTGGASSGNGLAGNGAGDESSDPSASTTASDRFNMNSMRSGSKSYFIFKYIS